MSQQDPILQELFAENTKLKRRIFELEKSRCFSPEDTLRLSIIDNSPFTVWACDRDFKIVTWNKKCEEVYGHTRHEAIGKDFTELFVDGPEKQAARDDCIEIIDKGKRCENFLAYDNDRGRQKKTMLTNCFRVWDEQTATYLQAEIGLNVDFDLRLERHKLQQLREIGIEMMQREKLEIEAKTRELMARIKAAVKEKELILYKKSVEVENWTRGAADSNVALSPEEIMRLKQENEGRRLELGRRALEIERSIIEIRSKKDVEVTEAAVVGFENEKVEAKK